MLQPDPPHHVNSARERHIGIQIAAAVLFVCIAMNLSMFVNIIEELWSSRHLFIRQQQRQRMIMDGLARQRVCVLVPGGGEEAGRDDFVWNSTLPGLAVSVAGARDFLFGVYVVVHDGSGKSDDNLTRSRQLWFASAFPRDSSLHLVRVYSGVNTYESLISAAKVDKCVFFMMLDQQSIVGEFTSPGWADALVRALQRFSPQYLGAASPLGCRGCIFVHSDTHDTIFSRVRYPLEECWSEWVRSVYGACRVVDVDGAAMMMGGQNDCSATTNRSSDFAALVSRGRLYISKILALGIEEFRASRWMRIEHV